MFEEVVLSGELVEDPVFNLTNAGTEYARLRVLVNRPWKRRGGQTFFSVFCYGEPQVALVRECGIPGAFVFCVGELRADWHSGGPQIRDGKGGPIATYDLTCRTLDFSAHDAGAREDKQDGDSDCACGL